MINIVKKLKSNVVLTFYRLYLKLVLLQVKRIGKCSSKNRLNVVFIIRRDIDKTYKNESIEFRINLSFAIVWKLLPLEQYVENDFDKENEIFISYEKSRFDKKPEIRDKIINHYRLEAYFYKYYNKGNEKKCLNKLQEVDSSEPLTDKEYEKLRRQIYKEHKQLCRLHGQRIKEEKKAEKLSKKTQIDFSPNDIKPLIGLASFLFLCSGYTYNCFFLGYFGIDVPYFFTINDYISTNLDKIASVLITLVLSTIIGIIWWSPEYIERRKKMSRKRLIFEDGPFYLTVLLLPAAVSLSIYFDSPAKYTILGFLLYIIFIHYASKLIIYFKKSLSVFLLISYFSMFTCFLLAQTMDERENIIKHPEIYKKSTNSNLLPMLVTRKKNSIS